MAVSGKRRPFFTAPSPLRTLLGLILVQNTLSLHMIQLRTSSGQFLTTKTRPAFHPRQSTALSAETKNTLRLASGKSARIRSRIVPITSTWNVTVWEWDEPSKVMEHYWNSQADFEMSRHATLLDPFGLVAWPGSVVAAQELWNYKAIIQNSTVLVLGAGPGVEAQALAMLGAKTVIATDIHPTTLELLRYGAQQAGLGAIITEQVFDICSDTPLPECDIMVVADVLYNEHLALHVRKRCVEALNKQTKILITDSQRFTDLLPDLNAQLGTTHEWTEQRLNEFTGSGVMVDEDQTYNVTVRILAIGW